MTAPFQGNLLPVKPFYGKEEPKGAGLKHVENYLGKIFNAKPSGHVHAWLVLALPSLSLPASVVRGVLSCQILLNSCSLAVLLLSSHVKGAGH